MQSLAQNATLEELAQVLYGFLPGTPHPYANQNLSFPAIASTLGLGDCWPSQGNKRQRIRFLLDGALERGKFNSLVKEVVKRGMTHHRLTRPDAVKLNRLIDRIGFRIPELSDRQFLDSLPTGHSERAAETHAPASLHEQIATLSVLYKELRQLAEVPRGFAFEKFLSDLFWAFRLSPRGSFKIKGEQIDGSFTLAADTYLVSARWRSMPSNRADLVDFSGTIEAKAQWSRGLFISQNGFGSDGLVAFGQGRPTNIICMNGAELSVMLENKLSLPEVISAKTRRAAETNEAFVPVWSLFSDLKR